MRNCRLFCSGCGETDKKLFLHIETERDLRSKRDYGIRIYECKVCGEQFTQFGHYDGGNESVFVVRDDDVALENGFNLLSEEDGGCCHESK